jgi:hypothetical protein
MKKFGSKKELRLRNVQFQCKYNTEDLEQRQKGRKDQEWGDEGSHHTRSTSSVRRSKSPHGTKTTSSSRSPLSLSLGIEVGLMSWSPSLLLSLLLRLSRTATAWLLAGASSRWFVFLVGRHGCTQAMGTRFSNALRRDGGKRPALYAARVSIKLPAVVMQRESGGGESQVLEQTQGLSLPMVCSAVTAPCKGGLESVGEPVNAEQPASVPKRPSWADFSI